MRQTRKRLAVGLAAAVLYAWPAAAQTPAQPARQRRGTSREFLGLGREPDAASAARGAKLYAPACGFCHGPAARGAEGPDLVRSTIVLHDDKGELVGPLIRAGRPGTAMPAFPSFSDTQLNDVAEFLHMQVELAANRGKYKVLNIVTGDPEAGATYFKGEGKCTTCHSVTGDLAHVASKYEPPDLQQVLLYPQVQNNKGTVTLPDGKTITGTIKHLDDFYVSLSDAAGDYRSVRLVPGVKVELDDKLTFHRSMLARYTEAQMHNLTAYLVTLK